MQKATRIRIEFEGGLVKEADGDDAAKIWDAMMGAQSFQAIHGFDYQGPTLKTVAGKEDEPDPSLPVYTMEEIAELNAQAWSQATIEYVNEDPYKEDAYKKEDPYKENP